MREIISLATLFVFILLAGCELDTTDQVTKEANKEFETESLGKIFTQNCASSGCHSSNNPQNGLSLATQSELFEGSSDRPIAGASNYGGDVVIPYNVKKSLLYQFITGTIKADLSVDHVILTGSEVLEIKEWIEEGAKNYQLEVPFTTTASYRVYVCNMGSDAISVIDAANRVVSRIVDVGFTDNFPDIPSHVEEKEAYYYVTLAAKGKFLKIRKSDNEIVGEISNLQFPGDFVLMDSAPKAYIARSLGASGTYNSIYSVNYETMRLITEVILPYSGLPVGVELSSGEQILYVSNKLANAISLINTVTDDTGNYFPIAFFINYQPTYLKLDPFGNYLYASAPGTNELLVVDLNSRLAIATVPVSPNPMQIAVKSDGSKIYVTSLDGHVVDVIDIVLTSWTKTRQISHPAFNMLDGIAITKDDGLLYVTSRNSDDGFEVPYPVVSEGTPGCVGIISTGTESVLKVIEVEEIPGGIATE